MSIFGSLLKAGIDYDGKDIKLPRSMLDINGRTYRVGNTTTVTVVLRDADEKVLLCYGTTVPSSEAGYAKGCTFIKTNAGAGTSGTYTNIGTTTACNFSASVDAPPAGGSTGTATSGSTATEGGTGAHHVTTLVVSTTLPAIAGGAALGVGKELYTFPAGVCIVRAASMSMAITQTQGHITANQPKVGLGTVIASGAVSDLTTPATFQDILTGQTAADCNGTATVKTTLTTASPFSLIIEKTGGAAHKVFFNAAASWSASGDAAALLVGTVVIDWTFLGSF